jgi:hypothetical protein
MPKSRPIFGIEFVYGSMKNRTLARSLDRIDSALGYTPGNVAIISTRANHIKRDASVAELRKIIAYIQKYTKKVPRARAAAKAAALGETEDGA